MMAVLGFLIFLVLTIVAVLHVYWACGGLWPGQDERSLARTVVGSKGISRMPRRVPTLAIAILIFLAGRVAAAQADILPAVLPAVWQTVAVALLAAVFLARGLASFTPSFRKSQSEQPFSSLDRRFYGPLCLALGLGFALLAVCGTSI